ncbi:MAG: CvpA family protein [Lewinellaceae bacterium]|nr:CvpA family protein [Lewinellaceae bacterium]
MPIDLICLAALGYGFWQGFSRGIIGTVFNVAAYLFGIVLSFKMTPTTTNILERMFNSDNPGMFMAAFVVNLVLVMLVLRAVAKTLESTFRAFYLGFLNQMAGGLLMGGVAVVLYSVLLWFFVKASIVNDATIDQSRLYEPYLKELPTQAFALAKRFQPMAEDIWDASLNWMDTMEQHGEKKTEATQKIYQIPDDGTGIEDDPVPSTIRQQDTGNGIEE